MKNKILAIIGARSGSKELISKNIKKLGNKPLMAWIIGAAKKSKLINRVIVSTDSVKYAKIANKFGAETPILRPKQLAKDNSRELDFIKHMLNYLDKKENFKPDIIVRLLATCPFQKTKDIDKLIKLILKKKYESAVIISKARQHPEKALKIVGNKNKRLVSYISNKGTDVGSNNNRQAYTPAYFRANVIACRPDVIKKNNSLTSKKVGYLIISTNNFVDIDSEIDFKIAKYYRTNI
jgi:N-acylneuraminate cytidylyltransferase/CMP-N,N'-diacetyllegionaminic acid synthase